MDESEDGEDAEAKEDDGDAEAVDGVAEAGQLGRDELVGALNEEEVEEDFAADVEDEAEVDGGAAAAFGREVPCVDQEAGGEDEAEGHGVDC